MATLRSLTAIAADLSSLAEELRAHEAPAPRSTILNVPCGSPIQAAIDAALPGDTIVLEAGCRYVGAIVLGPKAGLVTITSSTRGELPDRRIGPADAPGLATIAAGRNEPAILGTGATNWKIDGVQLESTPTGAGEVVVFQEARNIELDRVLLVAGPNGQKRGVRLNGQAMTVRRSHIANIVTAGQDSQAIAAWDGAGPYNILDNYLEASGENLLFGGSDNATVAANPADILVAGNHLFKPDAWRALKGTVKNLFELKNATRVVVRDNLMEGCWSDAQSGWAIVFTPRNQGGRAPWSVVKDVLFERNVVRGSRGFNFAGYDNNHVSGQMTGIVVRRNLFEGGGHFFQLSAEIGEVTFEDNVADNGYNIATLFEGDIREVEGVAPRKATVAASRLTFNRNLARHNAYGIIGGPIGKAALDAMITSYTFLDNKFVGLVRTYPVTTTNATDADLVAAKAALLAELGR